MPRLQLTHIVIHHTAAEEKDTEQIRRYHMSKGWRDIGYDYVIEKDGKVVEGRSLAIQGAHAGVAYYNQHAIGIAIIGHLSKREMYPKQFDSLVKLLKEIRATWGIPVNNILLHREIKSTECPGNLFPKKKLLELLNEDKKIGLTIRPEQSYITKNLTERIELPVPAKIENGHLIGPLRTILETLGHKVEYNSSIKETTVY